MLCKYSLYIEFIILQSFQQLCMGLTVLPLDHLMRWSWTSAAIRDWIPSLGFNASISNVFGSWGLGRIEYQHVSKVEISANFCWHKFTRKWSGRSWSRICWKFWVLKMSNWGHMFEMICISLHKLLFLYVCIWRPICRVFACCIQYQPCVRDSFQQPIDFQIMHPPTRMIINMFFIGQHTGMLLLIGQFLSLEFILSGDPPVHKILFFCAWSIFWTWKWREKACETMKHEPPWNFVMIAQILRFNCVF